MRISKAYWIWGQFSINDTLYLNSIKDNVQISLKSPKFDIHLTLCGPYEKLAHDFLYNLNNLSNKNQSIISQNKSLLTRLEKLEKLAFGEYKSKDLATIKLP